jgi:hypothetical protein
MRHAGWQFDGWRRAAAWLALGALPVVLALAGYYRAQLAGKPLPFPHGDAAFYVYQLVRAAELDGQWWRVGQDSRIGDPYPTEFAKHPGLYEGVDLMLLATLVAGAFNSTSIYHAAVLTALAFNGWIAAWIVWRATRSFSWSAMAATLITLNQSVAVRVTGHLHLFKFGWALLTVAAFVSFLEQPSRRRGLLLGLASALLLQSSFYLGYFMALGLAFWYLIEAARGRVKRGHLSATLMALAAFCLLSSVLCFPVWVGSSTIVASSQYFRRDWSETWGYGSEVWKYLIPRGSRLADAYYRDIHFRPEPPLMDEGWNFPGYTVLLAVLFVVLNRLRSGVVSSKVGSFVNVSLGLMAFWVVLSLSGGPSALIYHVVPSFRCYGRAGLLVVALGSVVAPIVLCELVRAGPRPWARALLMTGALLLAASDARRAVFSFPGWSGESNPPEWALWLKRQPADLRLAVFMQPGASPFDWWGQGTLRWLPVHGHTTLNGADFALFEGDLRLLGASYARINPAGLRFVVSLGYDALAFHGNYLLANPWIESLSWLEHVDQRGDWLICRARPGLARFPSASLQQIMARQSTELLPREAPPDCWVTDSWPITEDTIVSGSDWAFLSWRDDAGRPLCAPKLGLYQHVFGPGVPAYTIRTPRRLGSCRLVIEDRRHRRLGVIPYRIAPQLELAQPTFPARASRLAVQPIVLRPRRSDELQSARVTLLNTSALYLQSSIFREFVEPVSQAHPGMRSRWPRANAGALVLRVAPQGAVSSEADQAQEIPLPRDLPPGGRLRLDIPPDRLPASWADRVLRVEPAFAGLGAPTESSRNADIKMSVDQLPDGVARAQTTGQRPTR